MSATQVTPSRWYFALAGLVFLVGCLSFLWLLFTGLSGLSDSLTQIVVPGEHQLELAEAGTYTVFHEYESVVGNKVFATPPGGLANLQCSLDSRATGQQIPLTPSSMHSTYTIGPRSGASLFNFTIDAPGTYVFSAAYPAGQQGPEVVLAVGQGFMGNLLATVFGGLAIMFVTMFGALAIAAVTFWKRLNAKKRLASAAAADDAGFA